MKSGEKTIFWRETLCPRAWELIPSLTSSWFLLYNFHFVFYRILEELPLGFFVKLFVCCCVCTKETYCDMLVKYKSDLARPFDEATTFLNKVEMQLRNLCTGASVRSLSGQFLSFSTSLSPYIYQALMAVSEGYHLKIHRFLCFILLYFLPWMHYLLLMNSHSYSTYFFF